MFCIYGIVISILLVFFNISKIFCNLVFLVFFGAIDASVYMLLFVLIKIVVSPVALINSMCFVRIYEFL